jgi:very-short-patch-repair endonuclease
LIRDSIEDDRHIMIGEAERRSIVAHNLPTPAQGGGAGVEVRLKRRRDVLHDMTFCYVFPPPFTGEVASRACGETEGAVRDRERKLMKRAKELRGRMPNAEVILWSQLRQASAIGLRFRRQHPIGPYIADFACVLGKLVVEVDGGTHVTEQELAYDARRNAYMHARGWRVLRFANWEIYEHLSNVLDVICRYAPPPSRRSQRSGETPPP